jgi:hypothetical protein
LTGCFSIPCDDNPVFEVIGDTIVAEGRRQGFDTVLVSADKGVARQSKMQQNGLMSRRLPTPSATVLSFSERRSSDPRCAAAVPLGSRRGALWDRAQQDAGRKPAG